MVHASAKDGHQHTPIWPTERNRNGFTTWTWAKPWAAFFFGIVVHEGEATEAELRGVDLSRSRGATRQSSTHISKSGGHPHDARISRTAEDVSVKPLPRPSRSCPWHARSAPLLAKRPYWTRASCYLRLQTTKPKKHDGPTISLLCEENSRYLADSPTPLCGKHQSAVDHGQGRAMMSSSEAIKTYATQTEVRLTRFCLRILPSHCLGAVLPEANAS